jgi:hypothetical protein
MVAPTQPLSHHEILGLVGAFTRRGRHLDLPASDRLERRLLFKPILHAAAAGLPALRETLQLENPRSDTWRLTRVLTLDSGLEASLQLEGAEPGELLAQVEAVPLARQFTLEPGFELATCHRLEPVAAGRRSPRTAEPASAVSGAERRMVLERAVVQFDGLRLKLRVPAVTGISGEFELTARAGDTYSLPEDLLAVLGHDWSRLLTRGAGWFGHLRLRGSGPVRSADAEAKLLQTARHLAQALAEPPAVFHQRLLAARWGVTLRRGVPLVGCLLLLAAAAAVSKLELASDSVFRMLIFNAPPLLLVVFFSMREMPQIEIPPWPRALTAPAWRTSVAAARPDEQPGAGPAAP